MMNHTQEAELIAQSLTGDEDAFSKLINPYLPLFTAGIQRILQDPSDSQDALQEALLSIHTELHRFMGKSKFSTWAYRICINEALMFRRSRLRRREDALEIFVPHACDDVQMLDKLNTLEADSQETSALEQAQAEQLRQKIREGLSQLADDQRKVFMMREFLGMDTDEVAKALNISRGLVRQRLHRARLGLRDILAPYVSH